MYAGECKGDLYPVSDESKATKFPSIKSANDYIKPNEVLFHGMEINVIEQEDEVSNA